MLGLDEGPPKHPRLVLRQKDQIVRLVGKRPQHQDRSSHTPAVTSSSVADRALSSTLPLFTPSRSRSDMTASGVEEPPRRCGGRWQPGRPLYAYCSSQGVVTASPQERSRCVLAPRPLFGREPRCDVAVVDRRSAVESGGKARLLSATTARLSKHEVARRSLSLRRSSAARGRPSRRRRGPGPR